MIGDGDTPARRSLPPEILEARRRQLGIAGGVLDTGVLQDLCVRREVPRQVNVIIIPNDERIGPTIVDRFEDHTLGRSDRLHKRRTGHHFACHWRESEGACKDLEACCTSEFLGGDPSPRHTDVREPAVVMPDRIDPGAKYRDGGIRPISKN